MLIKIQKCEERTETDRRQTKGCGVRLLKLHNLCNLFQPGKSIDNVAIATAREKANTGCELTALSKPFKPVQLLTTALEPAACQRSPPSRGEPSRLACCLPHAASPQELQAGVDGGGGGGGAQVEVEAGLEGATELPAVHFRGNKRRLARFAGFLLGFKLVFLAHLLHLPLALI